MAYRNLIYNKYEFMERRYFLKDLWEITGSYLTF